jgi:hypothetical protein
MHSSVLDRQRARFAAPRERLLLGRRSARYIVAIHRLDRAAACAPTAARLAATVQAQFGPRAALPRRVVAACPFGEPPAVHSLDLSDGTVDHHDGDASLPPLLELACELACAPAHIAVEVYAGWLVCIGEDGSAVEVVP